MQSPSSQLPIPLIIPPFRWGIKYMSPLHTWCPCIPLSKMDRIL
jgi:hypothetical protein